MQKVIMSFTLVVFFYSWAIAGSSVWKAQKDNSIIYLGGTCHILREKDYPLPPEFDKAYRLSDILVFETDISNIQDPLTQQKLLTKATYDDGSTIDKHLSTRVYDELRVYCESNNIPLKEFRQFKPSTLMVMLTAMELTKLGVSQKGVDVFFFGLANKDKKVVEKLETIDDQINFVVSMADGNEDEFVDFSIKDMKTIKQQFEILVSAWRNGDDVKINELMITELKTKQPVLYKKLITDRNRNWLQLIDVYQKTRQIKFLLVGVGHLVGPDGIVEALKKKGYKVDKL